MRRLPMLALALGAALSVTSTPLTSAPIGAGAGHAMFSGMLTFQNNTNVTGHLYVDGNYGCGPVLMNLFCSTNVAAGQHTAYAKFDDGDTVDFGAVALADGESKTLTVSLRQN